MYERDACAHPVRHQVQVALRYHGSSLAGHGSARRRLVQHDRSGSAGQQADVSRGAQRPQVKNTWAERNQHQVGRPCGRQGRTFRVRCCVDDCEISPVRAGRAKRVVQARGWDRGNHGAVECSVVAPSGGARLRVEINEDRTVTARLRCYS